MKENKLIKLFAVGVLGLLVSSASGIPLVYEEGPLIGQTYNGAVTMKSTLFTTGSTYANVGGYTGLPDAGGAAGANGRPLYTPLTAVETGVSFLDGWNAPPVSAQATGVYAGAEATAFEEDNWGIFRISRIEATSTGWAVYTPAVKGYDLTGMISGQQDTYVAPGPDPVNEIAINSVGLKVDLYRQPVGPSAFDPTLGPGARLAGNVYPNINDAGQILELSTVSLPGFLNAAGVQGGLSAEYINLYNFTTTEGDGGAYMEIAGGASALQFDTDFFAMPGAAAGVLGPLGYDLTADLSLQFDIPPPTGPLNGWLVRADDPINAFGQIPEPATLTILLLGALFGIKRGRR